MEMPKLENLSTPEQQSAALRSLTYRAFAESFEYPGEELTAAVRDGSLAATLRQLLEASLPEQATAGNWDALRQAGAGDELAVEFTRLFDVGANGPPCPLYGAQYSEARMKTMEEAVRFYNHFGLSTSRSPQELPDHLTTQLEFLHFLAYREAEALQAGQDPGPTRRAQRDFIARHPGAWLGKLKAKLADNEAMPFFLELATRLEAFLAAEAARLIEELGPVPASSSAKSLPLGMAATADSKPDS